MLGGGVSRGEEDGLDGPEGEWYFVDGTHCGGELRPAPVDCGRQTRAKLLQ